MRHTASHDTTTGRPPIRVAICVATFRRPDGLRRLLQGLKDLQLNAGLNQQIQLVIADNDVQRSGEVTVEELRSQIPFRVNYVVEPRAGISFARNASLAAVDPQARFLAFIDDDEFPHANWLQELLDVQAHTNADVVAGPVIPEYPPSTPAWVRQGRYFEWPRYPTGTELRYARTGNVLIRGSCLRDLPGPVFDPRFALTGGEDHDLFLRLKRRGARIVWADEAWVYEPVALDRLHLSWILRRAFRLYASHTLCERELRPWWSLFPHRALTGSLRIALGIGGLLPATILPKHYRVNCLVQIARGLGLFAGMLGWQYREYLTPPRPSLVDQEGK